MPGRRRRGLGCSLRLSSDRQPGHYPEAARRTRPCVQTAAQQKCPLPHPHDAVTATAGRRTNSTRLGVPAWPVVLHLDNDRALLDHEPNLRVDAPSAMLEHIGESLLDDAVREQVHAGRQLGRHQVDGQRNIKSGVPNLLDQPGQLGEPRLRTEAVRVRLRAQDPDQVAEFGQSLASSVFDCSHRPYRTVNVVSHDRLRRTCLYRHQAHPVSNDVVQLSGNARPFFDHDPPGFRGLFPSPLGGPFLPHSEPAPDIPRQEQDEPPEDGVAPGKDRVQDTVNRHNRDGSSDEGVAPLVCADVPTCAVQGDDGYQTGLRVPDAEGHDPAEQSRGQDGQGCASAPGQGRAGGGGDQQGTDRDIA